MEGSTEGLLVGLFYPRYTVGEQSALGKDWSMEAGGFPLRDGRIW
jgi:hypothetical protein